MQWVYYVNKHRTIGYELNCKLMEVEKRIKGKSEIITEEYKCGKHMK